MSEIRFVSVKEFDAPEYKGFDLLTEYDREHPLHRFYEYIVQYFGGIREDVILFFCDNDKVRYLEEAIEDGQEPGLRNEWYRRLIRLLQCNAEAEWYELFQLNPEKTKGYLLYFFNQLPWYAEMGMAVADVKTFFLNCDAAYLLEYRLRSSHGKKTRSEEKEEAAVTIEDEKLDITLQQLISPLIEGQKQMLQYMELYFSEHPVPELEQIVEHHEDLKEQEVKVEENIEENKEVQPDQEVKTETNEEEIISSAERKDAALRMGNLFQKIRIKRKSVQLRKMDQKQQLEELIKKMNKVNFSSADMKVVRELIDKDISLTFLYAVIEEEQEPALRFRQMNDFLKYEQEKEEK